MALKAIRWAAIGLVLSMSLGACAGGGVEAPKPDPLVIIKPVKDTAPAELVVCPVAPEGLPVTGYATLPPEWRVAVAGLARAYGQTADQLRRLIAWQTDKVCDTS